MHLSKRRDPKVVLHVVMDIVSLSLYHSQTDHEDDDDPCCDYCN